MLHRTRSALGAMAGGIDLQRCEAVDDLNQIGRARCVGAVARGSRSDGLPPFSDGRRPLVFRGAGTTEDFIADVTGSRAVQSLQLESEAFLPAVALCQGAVDALDGCRSDLLRQSGQHLALWPSSKSVASQALQAPEASGGFGSPTVRVRR